MLSQPLVTPVRAQQKRLVLPSTWDPFGASWCLRACDTPDCDTLPQPPFTPGRNANLWLTTPCPNTPVASWYSIPHASGYVQVRGALMDVVCGEAGSASWGRSFCRVFAGGSVYKSGEMAGGAQSTRTASCAEHAEPMLSMLCPWLQWVNVATGKCLHLGTAAGYDHWGEWLQRSVLRGLLLGWSLHEGLLLPQLPVDTAPLSPGGSPSSHHGSLPPRCTRCPPTLPGTRWWEMKYRLVLAPCLVGQTPDFRSNPQLWEPRPVAGTSPVAYTHSSGMLYPNCDGERRVAGRSACRGGGVGDL